MEQINEELIPNLKGINDVTRRVLQKVQHVAAQTDGLDGISTGFKRLDNVLSGFKEGDVYTIGGRPSMGKTAFAMSLINNIAVEQHVPTLLFSMESNAARCAHRIIANHCDISFTKILNATFDQYDWERLDKQISQVVDSPLHIDETASLSVDDICDKAKECVIKHGIKIIFIDYLQLITTPYRANRTRNDDVAEIMHKIKGLARELSIPIVLLSQLNRCPENREGIEGKRPMLYDLRDSGTIEEDSDAIIFLHRPEFYHIYQDDNGRDLHNMAQIIIKKNRTGYTGEFLLRFDGEYCRFSEPKNEALSSRHIFSQQDEDSLPNPLPF